MKWFEGVRKPIGTEIRIGKPGIVSLRTACNLLVLTNSRQVLAPNIGSWSLQVTLGQLLSNLHSHSRWFLSIIAANGIHYPAHARTHRARGLPTKIPEMMCQECLHNRDLSIPVLILDASSATSIMLSCHLIWLWVHLLCTQILLRIESVHGVQACGIPPKVLRWLHQPTQPLKTMQ